MGCTRQPKGDVISPVDRPHELTGPVGLGRQTALFLHTLDHGRDFLAVALQFLILCIQSGFLCQGLFVQGLPFHRLLGDDLLLGGRFPVDGLQLPPVVVQDGFLLLRAVFWLCRVSISLKSRRITRWSRYIREAKSRKSVDPSSTSR